MNNKLIERSFYATSTRANYETKALPGIDMSVALSAVCHDSRQLHKLLLTLYQDYRNADVEILHALERGAREAAQRLLHTLKGTAATLGAGELSQASAGLEATLEAGDDITGSYEHFRGALKTLMEGLAFLQKSAPTSIPANGDPDLVTLTLLIPELAERLSVGSFQATELLPEISQALDGWLAGPMAALEANVEAFRFAEAEELLEQIHEAVQSRIARSQTRG